MAQQNDSPSPQTSNRFPEAPPSTMTEPRDRSDRAARRAERRPQRQMVFGMLLVLFGLALFLATFVQSETIDLLFLPAIGLAFLAWGLAGHRLAPIIPGSILTGLGVGTYISQVWMPGAAEDAQGGVVTIGLAAGFLAIPLLARAVTRATLWWPLVPGVVLLVVGASLALGGPARDALNAIGIYIWPLALVLAGLYVLAMGRRHNR